MIDKRKHWFNFSFYDGAGMASSQSGYDHKNISLKNISENKKYAGIKESSTLISVSYLGFMTTAQMKGE